MLPMVTENGNDPPPARGFPVEYHLKELLHFEKLSVGNEGRRSQHRSFPLDPSNDFRLSKFATIWAASEGAHQDARTSSREVRVRVPFFGSLFE